MTDINSKIIAHRGASFDAPENTLPAIQLAWKQKIKRVEIDVHLTKENRIVAIHDANTSKISVKNYSIKEENLDTLQSIDIGSWKDLKWANTTIASLEEILKTLPKDGILVIEIKSDMSIVPVLAKALKHVPHNQLEFISFHYEILASIKSQLPLSKALWLLDLDYTKVTKSEILPLTEYISKATSANFDGLNLWAGLIANEKYIQEIKKHQLLVYIWTINEPKKALRFLHYGADAITTDRPLWMQQQLAQLNDE
jgi:glycerophosphoryl diester phosphodiesterase